MLEENLGKSNAENYEDFIRETYENLVNKKIGKVYGSRHYEGVRTGHRHQIDVSIEVTVADLNFLVLIECKYYKRKVEVGDLLTFASRLDDIGAHKGVLVSTIGFQEGACKVAKAHRIALVTTEPVWEQIMECRAEPAWENIIVCRDESATRDTSLAESRPIYYRLICITPIESKVRIREFWDRVIFDGELNELIGDEPKCSSCHSALRLKKREIRMARSEHVEYTSKICPLCRIAIKNLPTLETLWTKCTCGNMIHLSSLANINTISEVCACGKQYTTGEAENLRNNWRAHLMSLENKLNVSFWC